MGLHYLALRHAVDAPPLIGASASVAGCAGYYTFRYTMLRIPVAPKLSLSILTVTLIWVALQILGALIRLGDGQMSISYWSHIGGFAAGLALSAFFRAPDLAQTQMDKEVLDAARLKGPSARLQTARSMAISNPKDQNALRQWADSAAQMDDPDQEFEALSRLIELETTNEKIDDLGRLCEIRRASGIATIARLNYAKEFRSESPATSVKLLESIIIEVESPVTPEALFSLGDILYESDRKRADGYLSRLERDYSQHPACIRAKARGWLN